MAKLTLNNSAVTGNTPDRRSPSTDPTSGGVGGGGIINILGTVTLNGSQVNRNTANGLVGGGIANGDYMNFSGTTSFLTLNNSQVDDNNAPNAGRRRHPEPAGFGDPQQQRGEPQHRPERGRHL